MQARPSSIPAVTMDFRLKKTHFPLQSLTRSNLVPQGHVTHRSNRPSLPPSPGPRDPINQVTSYLDASFVYGSEPETAQRMRTYHGGLMKTLPVFRELGLKDLLPPNLHAPDEGCIRPSNDIFCFDAGESWRGLSVLGGSRWEAEVMMS